MNKKFAKIGQIQWLLFWISIIDPRFFIVWILSLIMDNCEE